MEMDLNRLQELWQEKEHLGDWGGSQYVSRFDKLWSIVDDLLRWKVEVTSKDAVVLAPLDGSDARRIALNGWDTTAFGPAKEGLTDDKAKAEIKNFRDKLQGKADALLLFENVWNLLGQPAGRRDKDFRIMSNKTTDYRDSQGDLSVRRMNPDAHFASNNHFFQIIRFLGQEKTVKTASFEPLIGVNSSKIPLVLRYPDKCRSNDNKGFDEAKLQKAFWEQQEILKKRFPLKFLWMWGNKETLITPLSLAAMRELLNSKLFSDLAEKNESSGDPLKGLKKPYSDLIDMDYDSFREYWKSFSNAILGVIPPLPDDKGTAETFRQLSRLVSWALLNTDDVVTINRLLTQGCKAVILTGPPGTGKTYEAVRTAEKLTGKSLEDAGQQIKIVQFHPSYSYEDFVEGIKPSLASGTAKGLSDEGRSSESRLSYEIKTGQFKEFCGNAAKAFDDWIKQKESRPKKPQPFVFIIDEINRADLSSVFGELLYCLEYRFPKAYSQERQVEGRGKVTLPYSGALFSIPDNVYIIGTMNNVDKSLVTFDIALRRRFAFYTMTANPEKLTDKKLLGELLDKDDLDKFIARCSELNRAIIDHDNGLGLNSEFQIGFAYFAKIIEFLDDKQGQDVEEQDQEIEDRRYLLTTVALEQLWLYHLSPLLGEYLGMQQRTEEFAKKLEEMKNWFVAPVS